MKGNVVIREVIDTDIAALSRLAVETYANAFGHTFCEADLASHLESNLSPACFTRILDEDVVLVADLEGRLVGYVQFGAAKALSAQVLHRLYVHPEFQNRGIGSLLMEAALDHALLKDAATVYLDVWEHNHGAQRFYHRYGFEVVGARTFEVESGAATDLDLVMVRRAGAKS